MTCMKAKANYRTIADAEIPLLLYIKRLWPRAAECAC